MEDIYKIAMNESGLAQDEIKDALAASIRGRKLNNVLIIPPDFTRFHSNSGFITNTYYRMLAEAGVNVDILPALGTHEPVSKEQAATMFGDIPYEKFLIHDWRNDVIKLGEVPADYLEEITEGLWHDPVSVEINRRLMDEKYDLLRHPHVKYTSSSLPARLCPTR